jgi:hypothetical protein
MGAGSFGPPPRGGYGASNRPPFTASRPPQAPVPPPPAPPDDEGPRVPVGALVGGGVGLALVVILAILGARAFEARRTVAKRAEVLAALGDIAKDAGAVYKRDHRVCPSATARVPQDETLVSGKKYKSTAADWQADKAAGAGFACLGFSVSAPQSFQYEYQAAPSSYTAVGRGDLDGDGLFSRYELLGHVSGNDLVPSPSVAEIDPME